MPFANPRLFRYGIGLMLAVIGALLGFAGLMALLALLIRPEAPLSLRPLAQITIPFGGILLWFGAKAMRKAGRLES